MAKSPTPFPMNDMPTKGKAKGGKPFPPAKAPAKKPGGKGKRGC